MLQSHLIAIPQYTLFKCFARYIHLFRLAQGMRESSSHLTDSEMDRFMNDILRTRIGRRVLAEQHIKLTDEFDRRNDTGVITELSNSLLYLIVNWTCDIYFVFSRFIH
jgi:hypothetical protein